MGCSGALCTSTIAMCKLIQYNNMGHIVVLNQFARGSTNQANNKKGWRSPAPDDIQGYKRDRSTVITTLHPWVQHPPDDSQPESVR